MDGARHRGDSGRQVAHRRRRRRPPALPVLESARAYALEKLVAAQETDRLQRRHAQCMGALFQRLSDAASTALISDDFVATRSTELDNLRAAMTWASSRPGDIDIALELLGADRRSGRSCCRTQRVRAMAVRADAPVEGKTPSPCSRPGCATQRSPGACSVLSSPTRTPTRSDASDAPSAERRAPPGPCRVPRAGGRLLARRHRGGRAPSRNSIDCIRSHGRRWLLALHLESTIRLREFTGNTGNAIAELQAFGSIRWRGHWLGPRGVPPSHLRGPTEPARRSLTRKPRATCRRCGAQPQPTPRRLPLPSAAGLRAGPGLRATRRSARCRAQALPLLPHTGLVSHYVPTLALVSLKRGPPDSAMRLLAAGDARLARGRLRRQGARRRAPKARCARRSLPRTPTNRSHRGPTRGVGSTSKRSRGSSSTRAEPRALRASRADLAPRRTRATGLVHRG